MPNLRDIGRRAEDRAAEYLLEQGFTIVTRRFTASGGEIDIVALDGETLVFVEVKERSGRHMSPEESVDDKKAARLIQAAEQYLFKLEQVGRSFRFDLLAIEAGEIRHHRDFIS